MVEVKLLLPPQQVVGPVKSNSKSLLFRSLKDANMGSLISKSKELISDTDEEM